MSTITGIYQRLWLPCNEGSGLELENIAADTPIGTGDILPADAWDNYDGGNFRASVDIGDANFKHNDVTSLALLKAKYSGHVDSTFGTRDAIGDSCFGACMFSIESTSTPGIIILEIGSDPSFLTIGKGGVTVSCSIMDQGLGSPDNPNNAGNNHASFTTTNDGTRRIYAFAVLSERNRDYPGDHCKNTFARFEFNTSGALVTSDHGVGYSVGDSRCTTDGDAIDDKVDVVNQPISGTLTTELFGWHHSYFPHGYRPQFGSSEDLYSQALATFTNWGNDTKTLPQEWLDVGPVTGKRYMQRRGRGR